MHKVIVLYSPPKDPEHFREHYREKHLPLVAKLPGLLASRHSFSVQGVNVTSPYFCIWEGEFASEAALGEAMGSPIGREVDADAANYSNGHLILHYEVDG